MIVGAIPVAAFCQCRPIRRGVFPLFTAPRLPWAWGQEHGYAAEVRRVRAKIDDERQRVIFGTESYFKA